MRRFAFAIIVAFLAIIAAGVSSLIIAEPCSGSEPAGDDEGVCLPTCVTCGCCAQAVEPAMLAVTSALNLPVAEINRPVRHLPKTDPCDIPSCPAFGRRRPEIAVRMALGASAGGVVRLVLRRAATLLVLGTACGIGLSLWAAKLVDALLFGVDARDPITLAGAASVLVAVGLFAGWLPARQASRLDPTTALKD